MCNRWHVFVDAQPSSCPGYRLRPTWPGLPNLHVPPSSVFPLFVMSSAASSQLPSTIGSTYGSPPRRSRVRYLSPASLKLGHVFEQNRQRLQHRDGGKQPELVAPPLTKGKPRLLLMGQRRYERPPPLVRGTRERDIALTIPRSGKSSISSVVFHKLPPSETLFLESTARIQKDAMT